jgi:YtkA-like
MPSILRFAGAATLFLASCSKPVQPPDLIASEQIASEPVAIEHEISPEPARVGPANITLRLADAAAKPITGARIALEADMSHAGMSPLFAEARETEPGRYQARLTFQMAGDWVILLHITLPSGKKLERQIDVRGVRPI